ncbi:hypothetical protein M3231_25100 [Neobacillus mesonae]|nr:hypothetical protein [Neobacillus mesonae]
MIDFLKNRGIKAYHEVLEIAEYPNLLFSNDPGQYLAEARYNLYTIQKLNKLIKRDLISLSELEQVLSFIESSWSAYVHKHYRGKSFLFYLWGDVQIPAIRFSIVSLHEGMELPFRSPLNKVNCMSEVLTSYLHNIELDEIPTLIESDSDEVSHVDPDSSSALTVYYTHMNC